MKSDAQIAIKQLLDRIRTRNAAFESRLAAAAPFVTCAIHSCPAPLDHAKTLAKAQIIYTCPECSRDARLAAREATQDRVGVPVDVRHATFENFDHLTPPDIKPGSMTPQQFLQAAADFLAAKFRNLVLAGSVGIGKGHLAAAIVNSMIDQDRVWPTGPFTIRWTNAHRFFRAIHDSYGTTGPEPLIEYYGGRSVLILDECALAPMPADGVRTLYDIIDARHKAGQPTILISNQPAPALKAWLTPPVVDRLRSGGLRFCWGEWTSARGQEKDRANDNHAIF